MILLDMRTIMFSYVLVTIVCMVVIILLWQQNRTRLAGTIFWVADFVFQTLALFLIVLRGQIPDWMSFVLANVLMMTGALLGYMGLLRFVGEKSSQLVNYVLIASFAAVDTYFTFVQPDQTVRNLNVSVGLLIICFQCAWLLLYRVKPGMRQLTRGVGIVFGAYCLVSLIRIVEYFTGAYLTSDYLWSGTFEQLILISNQMLFILLTHSLVLMFNKRLIMDIQTQVDRFSKAFHSSPYAITITRSSDGQIIEVNEGFLNITGYQYPDVIGKSTIDLRLWAKDEDRVAVVNELLSKGKVIEREYEFRIKSGEIITGIFSAEIYAADNEKLILSNIGDITERRLADKAIKESERVKEKLIEKLNDAQHVALIGSWEWDLQTHTVWWSDETYLIFGVTKQDYTPGFEENGKFIHPDDFVLYKKSFEHCLRTGEQLNVNLRLIAYDGKLKYCHVKGKIILDDSGQQICFIGTIMDITERKQTEYEIARLNAELEIKIDDRTRELRNSQLALLNLVDDLNQSSRGLTSANEALDAINKELASFSYSVSHDLRAPLRSIDGFSQALLEDCWDRLNDDGKKYLERIRRATQNMGALIDDMLSLSRVTQSEFCREEIDLSKMVREIVDEHLQKNPPNGMVVNIKDGIFILGDQRLMRIAMTNLLDNAWKFTGEQEHPRIEFNAFVKDSKTIIFVRDNGVGFDMNYAGKLFGAFQRLHRSDEFPGTGIGLATIRRVMNRHGGRVWAEGETGKGATIYFTIPGKEGLPAMKEVS